MSNTFGIDAGNYMVKVVGRENILAFASDLGEWRERKLIQDFGDDLEIEYQGKRYFGGTLARNESEFGGSMLGGTKAHFEGKLRVLIALHRATNQKIVNIVVAQPVNAHDPGEKKKICEMLLGRHEIIVNNIKKDFHIARVEVACEGGAAFWAMDPTHDGLIRIVDIGSGTVNMVTLQNRKYIDKASCTLDYGTETGKSNNVEAMAEAIARQGVRMWKREDEVYIAGGMAEIFHPVIVKHFSKAKVLYPIWRKQELEPMYANATGLFNIGATLYGL